MNAPDLNEAATEFFGNRLAHTWEAYATHQPLLVWALNNSTGPIVEMGIGHYSTPLIAAASQRDNRKAFSLEDNVAWLNEYSGKGTTFHHFDHVTSWPDEFEKLSKKRWGLIFVDQEDHVMRTEAIRKLHPCCDFIILHDSDMHPECKCDDYDWWEFFPKAQPWPERGGPPSLLIRSKPINP